MSIQLEAATGAVFPRAARQRLGRASWSALRDLAARGVEFACATVFRPRCQREHVIVALSPSEIVQFYRLRRAGVEDRVRTRLRREERAPGKPSVFAPGQYVRVKDAEAIAQTLDARLMHRGLLWSDQQWAYCGTVHRVERHVRRIIDDAGVSRAVSGTVLLEDVTCTNADGSGGCGKLCPLFFRDEWLEAAS